ncbi:hypothetical protein CCR94_12760 [Rhodoblastus sphagnicola]|uniref:Heme utilization protein n=1 Tax=Rhodoblastus sphagnicola TaxID=333368 RepID=A0A2S6N6E5_9HYPH|nr:hypothetical protein [Rhodoblastus sphagnicola]MBB4197708.1 hypothetical protein [Rhodoblastus sphagnicola]PPQ30193.1 hypothetical protein CCR94_12760 [Rhodoblastus sphagnicola]
MRAVRRLVPLLVLLPFAALAQDGGLASKAYDGKWRVAVQTTVGDCAPATDVVVTVKDAKIVAVSAGGIDSWGYIDAANTVVGRFSQGERAMRANGAVKGDSASGAWSANTDYCGGRWTATRAN